MANQREIKFGIMGAMEEEIEGIISLFDQVEQIQLGNRVFYQGSIASIKVVLVFSRWGKVAASSTVSALIHQFGITHVIFTGVAGAIASHLKIGDIIIGKRFIQHDLDARPIMKQFEIPLLSKTYIDADSLLLKYLVNACEKMVHHPDGLAGIKAEDLQEFEIIQPQIYVADIASGDQFFGSLEQKNHLLEKLPETYCVEMEGAAVAQVCFEYDIPFCIVRTISDSADHEAHLDFPKFLKTVSGKFSTSIVQEFFNQFSYENQSANR